MKKTEEDALTAAIVFLCVLVLYPLLIALPVMCLWNYLCPTLFKVPTIDFYQALGLSVLCNMLFKGSGGSKS